MEDALLEVIRRIVEDKRKSDIFPDYALSKEVYEEVGRSLNNLYAQGKIKVGQTLNYKWIEIVAKNDS